MRRKAESVFLPSSEFKALNGLYTGRCICIVCAESVCVQMARYLKAFLADRMHDKGVSIDKDTM